MGAAGRERARRLFDWSVIVKHYQELWAEQAAIRAAAAPPPATSPVHPLRDNPFLLFGHYATRTLGAASRLRAVAEPPAPAERLGSLRMVRLEERAPNPSPLTWKVLARLREAGRRGLTLGELLGDAAENERKLVSLAVVWLMKLGLVE